MSAQTKQDIKTWFHTVVDQFVGKNIRQYRTKVLVQCHGLSGAYGIQLDIKPFKGKVVMTEPYLVIKEDLKTFAILDRLGIDQMPDVGDTVTITPYARRDFSGRFGYEPKTETYGGVAMSVYQMGGHHTNLPLQDSALSNQYLRDLVRQINNLPAPDGFRNLAQLLADANATDFVLEQAVPVPKGNPAICCQVNTAKHRGHLRIEIDLGSDSYTVSIGAQPEDIITKKTWVLFDDLGQVLLDLIDDGQWQIARVVVESHGGRRSTRLAA